MADSTNNIDIVVKDSVDAGIAPKLIALADASDRAEKSTGSLKAQLDSFKTTGLGGLLAMLSATGGSTAALAKETEGLVVAERRAAEASAANSIALKEQRASTIALREAKAAAAAQNLAAAAKEREESLLAKAAAKLALAADREASLQAQAFLAEESAMRAVNIKGFLEAAAAADLQVAAEQRLQAEWVKEQIATDARISKELELARVRELSALKADIIQRSPESISNDSTLAANRAEATAATEAQALAERDLQVERQADLAQGSQMALLENEMMNIRREDIVLLDSQTVSSQRRNGYTVEETALIDGLALAEQNKLVADERLLEINQLITSVMGQQSAAFRLNTESKVLNAVATERQAVSSAHGVTQLQATSGAVRELTGSGSIRALENFLAKTLSLGPILVAAFPIIGAIALILVIEEAIKAFDKFITKARNAARDIAQAFDEMTSPLRKTNDLLAVTNDRLDRTIAKLEHRPATNGAQLALDQAREAADRLDDALERVDKDIDKVLAKNRLGLFGALFTGQAGTKDTENLIRSSFERIDKAREASTAALDQAAANKDPKAAQQATLTAYAEERKAILQTISTLNTEYNTRKKIQDEFAKGPKQVGTSQFGTPILESQPDQTANLTMLGKSVRLANEELRGLDLTMGNIDKNNVVEKLRDQASGLKIETKEAAAEWKQLLADFVAFQTAADLAGHKATAQESLAFLQSKEPTINPLNRDKLTAKELPFQNQINGHNFGNQQIEKLASQAANMNLYGTALKETTELDRIFQEAEKKGFTLSQDQIDILTITNDYIHQNLQLQQEKTSIQKSAIDVEQKYALAVKASEQVMAEHPELADAIGRDLNRLKIAHDDAKNPVLEFTRSIDNSRQLLGKYGDELKIATEVQALAEELRSRGVTNFQELAEAQRANIAQTIQEQSAQQANNALYEATTGAIEKMTDAKNALNAASSTELSNEAKQSAIARVNADINDRKLETGQIATKGSVFGSAITDYAKQFTTVAAGIKQTFQGVFKTLADGFADSIGRAIVYAHNLGDALKEVARSAISELISGLIKLGIQYLILWTVKKLFGEDSKQDSDVKKQITNQVLLTTAAVAAMLAVTAAGVTAASVLSAAWWPVAEAVSLASFGANAVPASIGIVAVQALGQLGAVPKFDVGTNYVPYDMLAQIHKGEAIIPAADNKALRAAVGASPTPQVAKPASNAPGSQTKIEFHDHVGVALQVQHMDENTVRLIVRQESPALIQQHAPGVIAREVQNPNSSTSKSIGRNVTPSRVR